MNGNFWTLKIIFQLQKFIFETKRSGMCIVVLDMTRITNTFILKRVISLFNKEGKSLLSSRFRVRIILTMIL